MGHVEEMGMRLPEFMKKFWYYNWIAITPVLVGVVTILGWAFAEPDEFLDYEFPLGAQILGWLLELNAVIFVAIVSAFTVFKRWRAGKPWAFVYVGPMLSPNKLWGPRADRPGAEAVIPPRQDSVATAPMPEGKDNKSFDAEAQPPPPPPPYNGDE